MNPVTKQMPGVVRWFGGKGQLLKRVLPLIPYGHRYVEPCGGAGTVLLNRKPSPVEVYNDLDGNLVNLFRMLQDEKQAEQLHFKLNMTLYARAEFREALAILEGDSADIHPVLRAWAFFVAQRMGFSGVVKTEGRWGRGLKAEGGVPGNWNNAVATIGQWHERLKNVQVDDTDLLKCIDFWDGDDCVFYVDPPYVHAMRTKNGRYAHELTDSQHAELVELLLTVKGSVTLSGYAHPLYEPLERAGWHRTDMQTTSYAASRARGTRNHGKGNASLHCQRIESVWLNPKAQSLLNTNTLF